jgi:hypothetical protein
MIRIDFGFKVGCQDIAPAAILFASVRAGLAFSEKPIRFGKHRGRMVAAAIAQRIANQT